MAPDQPKRYCPRCAAVGSEKQEIIIEGKTILNPDGSVHQCVFSENGYNWKYYSNTEDNISRWTKSAGTRTRGKKYGSNNIS